MSKKLKRAAKSLAQKGRYGDKNLIHVSDEELQWLASAGAVTINPETGLPEAFNLGHALSSAWHGVERPVSHAWSEYIKPVALPLAGAVGGFMLGGPWGAAAGAGLGEKAAGGTTNQALAAAALAFGGGEIAGGAGLGADASGVGAGGTATTGGTAAGAAGAGGLSAESMAAADALTPEQLAAVSSQAAGATAPTLSVAAPGVAVPVGDYAGAAGLSTSVNPAATGLGAAAVTPQQPGAPVEDLSKPYQAPTFGEYFPSLSSIATDVTGSGKVGNAMDFISSALGIKGGASKFGSIFDVGTGLYGLYEAEQQRKLAEEAMRVQDPFGPYRAQYARQLSDLEAHPENVTKLPGYGAGLEAVNRGLAASGYIGSGNQMAALQKYGGQFYNDAVARLAGLAGANISPVAAGNSLLYGNIAATQLTGESLNRMAYGVMH